MFLFVVAFLPVLISAAHTGQSLGTTTTPSAESVLLNLAASADETIGQPKIDTKFSCANRQFGYYADIGNDCKIYHICNPSIVNETEHVVIQYSFFCPVNQVFDQQAHACALTSTTPCHLSEQYYNIRIFTGSAHIPLNTKPVATTHVPVETTVARETIAPVVGETVAPVTSETIAPAVHKTTDPVVHETSAKKSAPVYKVTVPIANTGVEPEATLTYRTSQPTQTSQPVQMIQYVQQPTLKIHRSQQPQPQEQASQQLYYTTDPGSQQALYIKHFPEPNYHMLPDATFHKVLRFG